ncbi:MAG: VOC family protein [Pirellulales bacterium]|nr:VOC family protein [Pirellulales bacterium]MBX3434406.1 VOC family protein [Pirellulales bacterium]
MSQHLGLVSVVVRDYDEALRFYVDKLGFRVFEDKPIAAQSKRWVVTGPSEGKGCRILLARASSAEEASCIGAQAGGRVFLFLYTDDFWSDFELYQSRGVEFVRQPKTEPYGTVAVFKDLYGTLWDLIEPVPDA